MLSDEVIEKLSERLVNRIESLNTYMIKKIGEQIKNVGTLTPSQLREVFQSLKYGNDLDEIADKLAEITNLNIEDIYDIFEETAKSCQLYSKQFYDYKNIKFIPYDKNKALQEQVKSLARITANEYVNMSNTLAFVRINENGDRYFTDLSQTYQDVIDEAILSVSQGRESFMSVMRKTMRELTSSGIKTVDYKSGYSRRLDSAVRMNISTGLDNLHSELQERFGKEFGADGVEISHHKNPAPDHSSSEEIGWYDIDGRQFKLEEFEKINKDLNRHIGELNCKHKKLQIILGVSEPMYSEEQIQKDKEENIKGFEFQGKHYTNYEGEQLQRQLETKTREYRDRQIGAKSMGDIEEVYNCQGKIEELTKTYKELSDVSGLPTKIERLQVEGYRKNSGTTRKFYEEQLIGTKFDNYTINGISEHLLDRKTSRNVKVSDVKDTFANPLKIDKIKVDDQGRKSLKVVGEYATVSINPDSGIIITVWKTSSNRVRKLKGDIK